MNTTPTDDLLDCFARLAGREMPEDEKAIWRRICVEKQFPPKTQLLHLGDQPGAFYYILKGLARQFYIDGTGADTTRGFAREGEFCCTEALIEADCAPYCVETLEECRCVVFRRRDLEELLGDSVYMRDAYIQAMKLNIRNRSKREKLLITADARSRYESFLAMYPELSGRVKQVYLASYLGMNQVTLSRVCSSLRRSESQR